MVEPEPFVAFHKQPKLSKRKRTERVWAQRKSRAVELREELLLRSHGDCEISSEVCTGRGEQVHHALRRSQGGRDIPEHTRLTCAACHEHLHRNPAEAFERGWLLRKDDA